MNSSLMLASIIPQTGGFEGNTSTAIPQHFAKGITANNFTRIIFATFAFLVFFLNVFTCLVMKQTKRVPFAAKLLTCISLICHSVFILACGLASALDLQGLGNYSRAISIEAGRICIVISWIAVILMSLERVLCLYHPYFYSRKANNRNITISVAVCIGISLCLKLTVRYAVVPFFKFEEYDFVKATENVTLNTWILSTCFVVNTICYIAIFLMVRKQIKFAKDIRPSWEVFSKSRAFVSTKNISCIVCAFQLIHLPLVVTMITEHITKGSTNTYLVAIFMLIMCAANPVLFAWRFRECRLIILNYVNILNLLDIKVQRMRIEIYNIVESTSVINTINKH